MKTKHYIYIICAIISLSATTSNAQSLKSGYFLEGYTFGHKLNPAFMLENSYFSIPMLGNLKVGLNGNLGLKNFIYPYNKNGYSSTTFLSPEISKSQFLGGLNENNKLNADISMSILSFGGRNEKSSWNFELGIRSNTSANLPYELFDFMKSGMHSASGSNYQINNLTINTNNYAEAAFGYSREINDNLTVGAKIKFLIGIANINANIKTMNISMSQNEWNIDAEGVLEGSAKGLYFKSDSTNTQGQRIISGMDIDNNPGIGGLGAAVDFGAVYKMDDLVSGLTLSASVVDLGFISWGSTVVGGMQNKYTFKGFQNPIVIDPEDPNDVGDIDNQVDQMTKDLEDFAQFYDNGTVASRKTNLTTTINVGANYEMPFYRNLSLGVLSSTKINNPYTSTEGRIFANVAPVDWFNASVNYCCSTFGSSFGWMVNFHPKGFNFFIGSDYTVTSVTPQFIPINNMNADISIGMNITFGGNKVDSKNQF